MTNPCYPTGCADGSQEHGEAFRSAAGSPSDYAWYVSFNNGNSNYDNRDNNNGFVRAVRSVSPSEYQGVTFQDLCSARLSARRKKHPSRNQASFETNWIENLLMLEQQINTGAWKPSPSTCFIASKPKAREIHAPDFSDRVVHHWLVPQLEKVFEPGFIYDSFSNRKGKGTHAAVDRLKSFIREVSSGQGGGYYLQLDIHNFFNSIHRPTLYARLKKKLAGSGVSIPAQWAVHALLRHSPNAAGVQYKCTRQEREAVPHHKRLENAAPGCGLPIGNLSSQFFANVYMDALDQFVKHVLKVPRYLRYVDDFVLVHKDPDQLLQWQTEIVEFLRCALKLELKADIRLRPLRTGVDFLGYVLFPTHAFARRRVVSHAKHALSTWSQQHICLNAAIATPGRYRHIASVWGSYKGHLSHSNSTRLKQKFEYQFPWLSKIAEQSPRFDHRLEGKSVRISLRSRA